MPRALITGISGQDGSFLAETLLTKGYQVIGMISKDNDIGDQNIAHLKKSLTLETGDLLDSQSIQRIIAEYQPEEIYNFGGITFVPTSWEKPQLTHDVNLLGVLRILEAMKQHSPQSKLFQATSAKIFGESQEEKQTEATLCNPNDPYSVSKLAAHQNIKLYREHFHLFACSGILYNHESERRGIEFVTRKISQGVAKIKLGQIKKLPLGNLDAKADWGYAPDYVYGMWLMLQQNKADDYILATGELHTVREVCEIAFQYVSLSYKQHVYQDEQFYRPLAAKNYYGDPSKAELQLGWKRTVNFKAMIEKMVETDLQLLKS